MLAAASAEKDARPPPASGLPEATPGRIRSKERGGEVVCNSRAEEQDERRLHQRPPRRAETLAEIETLRRVERGEVQTASDRRTLTVSHRRRSARGDRPAAFEQSEGEIRLLPVEEEVLVEALDLVERLAAHEERGADRKPSAPGLCLPRPTARFEPAPEWSGKRDRAREDVTHARKAAERHRLAPLGIHEPCAHEADPWPLRNAADEPRHALGLEYDVVVGEQQQLVPVSESADAEVEVGGVPLRRRRRDDSRFGAHRFPIDAGRRVQDDDDVLRPEPVAERVDALARQVETRVRDDDRSTREGQLHSAIVRLRSMARVGFDGSMISPMGKGHARSERHAVEALAARGEHELIVFVREPVEIEGVEIVRVDPRLTIEWELRGMPTAAKRHRLDAFVTLSDRLPFNADLPTVVWLFESPVHRIRANRASRAPLWNRGSDLLTSALWKRSLRHAHHVAFGSVATRDEVQAELSLPSTSVVYPGVPPGFSPGPSTDRGAYVLHIGSNDPRDGTAVAVEACARAGVRLLVAGGWRGSGAESVGRVSDAELLDLYRGAVAFLDPTRYEGFGYGVLEAMASGAPVVASRVTSVPEVVGDAGLLCDPQSPESFAAAVSRLVGDADLRAALSARGLARASLFTWDKTGEGLSAAIG